MLHIKRILFPTDFSRCAEQAFQHALQLARVYEAEIHMLHAVSLSAEIPVGTSEFYGPRLYSPGIYPVDDTVYSREIDAIFHRLKKDSEAKMRSCIEERKAGNINVVPLALEGVSPAMVLVEHASEHDVDLVVIGTHGRRGIRHLFLGSVAEEVVRTAPCPVYTVRECDPERRLQDIETILVPIDFSDFSLKSLRYAKQLADTFNARLQLLHVVEPVMRPGFYLDNYPTTNVSDFIADAHRASQKHLEALLARTKGPEVNVDLHVTEGHAAQEILDFATDRGVDLIVIATHGLTGIEHLLVGSVTEKVVRQAPCPVLTLKAFGKDILV